MIEHIRGFGVGVGVGIRTGIEERDEHSYGYAEVSPEKTGAQGLSIHADSGAFQIVVRLCREQKRPSTCCVLT